MGRRTPLARAAPGALATGRAPARPAPTADQFARLIQDGTDAGGGEISPKEMWDAFADQVLTRLTPLKLIRHRPTDDGAGRDEIAAKVRAKDVEHEAESCL